MAIAPDGSHRDVPSWTFVVFLLGGFAITRGIVGSYLLIPGVSVGLFTPDYAVADVVPARDSATPYNPATGPARREESP